jgi:hypothetical protein
MVSCSPFNVSNHSYALLAADAGQIVNVFLAIVIGSLSLAMLPPELQGQLTKHHPKTMTESF